MNTSSKHLGTWSLVYMELHSLYLFTEKLYYTSKKNIACMMQEPSHVLGRCTFYQWSPVPI